MHATIVKWMQLGVMTAGKRLPYQQQQLADGHLIAGIQVLINLIIGRRRPLKMMRLLRRACLFTFSNLWCSQLYLSALQGVTSPVDSFDQNPPQG